MAQLEFILPDVGEGLAEGEIVRWHASPGDNVRADETLVEVETDKAIVELPVPADGKLVSIGAQAGEILPVGAVLATFEVADTGAAQPAPAVAESRPKQTDKATPSAPASKRALASPAIRKAARELGVDLSKVQGSGSRGQITRSDLEATQTAVDPSPCAASKRETKAVTPPHGEDRVEPLRGLRRRIAQTMEQAWRDIPHAFSTQDIDATQLVAARDSLNAEMGDDGGKLSYMPFFVRACVLALRENPSFNASIDTERGEIIYRHRINIGIATATADGLMVPVLHDADRSSISDIGRAVQSLAQSARARKSSVEELKDGTFTISNFGSYGAGVGMPIIRPPEVAIAGFGQIRDGVLAHNGVPVVRPILPVIVSTDHRLNDGQNLGDFMSSLTTYLREPIRLLAHA